MVNVKINSDFPEEVKAQHVVIKIPMPPTAASARCLTGRIQFYYNFIDCGLCYVQCAGRGYCRYEPGQRALVWRVSSFPGASEGILTASVDLLPATREKPWTRPPITLDFSVSMYSASGIQVWRLVSCIHGVILNCCERMTGSVFESV